MTPSREAWSFSVGFLPHKVTVYERLERKGALYLTWRTGGNWEKKSLRRSLRTVRGKIDEAIQVWAKQQAAEQYARGWTRGRDRAGDRKVSDEHNAPPRGRT